ncbi:MAG: hypothetical protein HY721_22135 [Planctomycetes bacterium]|nr:hypothetical protein [Planctomycetota bacterium]
MSFPMRPAAISRLARALDRGLGARWVQALLFGATLLAAWLWGMKAAHAARGVLGP